METIRKGRWQFQPQAQAPGIAVGLLSGNNMPTLTVAGTPEAVSEMVYHLYTVDKDRSLAHRKQQRADSIMKGGRRRTIAIDFDGPIHDMFDGFRDGNIYGGPVTGAMRAIEKLHKAGYGIVIHTTRGTDDTLAQLVGETIQAWQDDEGVSFPFMVTGMKIPAICYIDDRAIRFTNWEDIRKLYC